MKQDEVEAVLAHEVSHIANGDMVTLTLIQGVVNTFVIFLSRIDGHFVDKVILKNEGSYGIGYFLTTIAAQIVFGILASTIVMWFSRQREFRADAGGASLAGRQSMPWPGSTICTRARTSCRSKWKPWGFRARTARASSACSCRTPRSASGSKRYSAPLRISSSINGKAGPVPRVRPFLFPRRTGLPV